MNDRLDSPILSEKIGDILLASDPLEGIHQYKETEKIARDNWQTIRLLYKLADAYSRIQKYEDAQRLLQRSIWLDATSTGPFILMGKVLEKKGELDLAVISLMRAATMDPNNPMTHHQLGQAYREMGKKEEAESELKLAEELQTKQNPR